MGARLPVFTRHDNPAAAADTPAKQLTFSYLIGLNAWLLLSPSDLSCDWTMDTVPLVTGVTDPRNLVTLAATAVAASLVASAYKARSQAHTSIVIMALAMTAFPFLPASNIFFPVGFVVAERKLTKTFYASLQWGSHQLPSSGEILCTDFLQLQKFMLL